MDNLLIAETSLYSAMLQVLGIEQYRRRSLRVVSDTVSAQSQIPSPKETTGRRRHRFPEAPGTSSPASGDLQLIRKRQGAGVGSHLGAAREDDLATEHSSTGTQNFEVLVWRDPRILVLDVSTSEDTMLQGKHRLANNILRALWTTEFAGADVHQYHWPIPGVDAGLDQARSWLTSLVASHAANHAEAPVWLMGDIGVGLLFPEKSQDRAAVGRLRHKTLGVDMLLTPALGGMLQNHVTKAETWHLLNTLRD